MKFLQVIPVTAFFFIADHINIVKGTETQSDNDSSLANGHTPPYIILFLFTSFGIGVAVRTLSRKIETALNIHLPYTIVLLVIGNAVGVLATYFPAFKNFTNITEANPQLILAIFLPTLIFESAFALDAHTFLKSFPQIFLVAVPGLVITTVLTGGILMFLFQRYNWNFLTALLFGSVTSATDPVSVVALLRELDTSKFLSLLIEGESLVNDGSAIVFFEIVTTFIDDPSQTILSVFLTVTRISIGGPIFGYIMGRLTVIFLSCIFNDATSEITTTLVAAYVTYYIADEILAVSGVLAVLVLGIVLSKNKTSISPEVELFMNHFWGVLAYLSNTAIFVIVGIVISETVMNIGSKENLFDLKDFLLVLVTYVTCNITRAAMFIILSPILSRMGYGLSWQDAVIAIWGGLRGAVCLCLALLVKHSELGDNPNVGPKFLLHVAGLVALTLLINGTTIRPLLSILGLTSVSQAKRNNVSHAMKYLQDRQDRTIILLKMDRYLADANWQIVERGTFIKNPYETKGEKGNRSINCGFPRVTRCPEGHIAVVSQTSDHELKEEAKLRLLKAQKVSYWRQFEHGMLTKDAIRRLIAAVELATDAKDFIDVRELTKTYKGTGFASFLQKKLKELCEKKREYPPPPQSKWLRNLYSVVTHKAFNLNIYLIIILNTIIIISALALGRKKSLTAKIAFRTLNASFYVIYLLEAIMKILAFGCKGYFSSHWDKLDFTILIFSTIDLICDILYSLHIVETEHFETAVDSFRFLRLLRMFRLLKPCVPRAIHALDGQVDKKLCLEYEIGKGFVIGQEEISKILHQMIDESEILEDLQTRVDHDRLYVMKELGFLQRNKPWIAITIKTRQAIRTILNNMKEAAIELKDEGLLDDSEYGKLTKTVEGKIRDLTHIPIVQPCSPEMLLKSIPWLAGDAQIFENIEEQAEILAFNPEETLFSAGDMPSGVYVIVSGLVKLQYFPNKDTDKMVNCGALPVMDYISSLSFHETQYDYIVAGNIVGELSVITGRPHDVTLTCETSVQAYFIPILSLKEAMIISNDRTNGLEARMWRVYCIRLASVLLSYIPSYQSWTQEKIKFHLEKAYLPELGLSKTFEINEYMEDVLLIRGIVKDSITKYQFVAPACIPRTVHKLLLPGASLMNLDCDEDIETKLLIVPVKNADELVLSDSDTEMKSFAPALHQQPSPNRLGVRSSLGTRRKPGSGGRRKKTPRVNPLLPYLGSQNISEGSFIVSLDTAEAEYYVPPPKQIKTEISSGQFQYHERLLNDVTKSDSVRYPRIILRNCQSSTQHDSMDILSNDSFLSARERRRIRIQRDHKHLRAIKNYRH